LGFTLPFNEINIFENLTLIQFLSQDFDLSISYLRKVHDFSSTVNNYFIFLY